MIRLFRRKRKQRRRHIGPVVPQWDANLARKRVLLLVEALALQSREEYDRALEVLPFEAIANERDPVWSHQQLCDAIEILLNVQLAICLNERRLEPLAIAHAKVYPLRPLARCAECSACGDCGAAKEGAL